MTLLGGRLLLAADLRGRVDQGDVGEGLGKVAHQPTGHRVVLLGQEAEVVAKSEEPIEELAGVVVPSQQRKAVGQPERTGQEGAFPAGQPVDVAGVDGPVPQHESPLDQLALDGLDGSPDPRVVSGQEPDQRDHQQAGVELVGSVVLGERALVGVEALVADLVVDLLADLLPVVDRPVGACAPPLS